MLKRINPAANTTYGIPLCLLMIFILISMQAFGQQVVYSYDEGGRLASTAYDNGVNIQYSYDGNGNLLQRQIDVIQPSGKLQFINGTLAVNEDSGDITVLVQRLGGSNNAVSVAYTTADITAVAGTDYVADNGMLNWPDGDNSDRQITIVPIADNDGEPDETLALNLSNPAGGAELGSITSLTITLLDDDERFFADGFEG